jgi:hypothetical protein
VKCIGPATRRLAGQWLGAPVDGLDDLAATVFETTEAPLVPVTHPQLFLADIVLARGRVPAHLAGTPVSAAWMADSVVLVADRSSAHAVRYQDLAYATWLARPFAVVPAPCLTATRPAGSSPCAPGQPCVCGPRSVQLAADGSSRERRVPLPKPRDARAVGSRKLGGDYGSRPRGFSRVVGSGGAGSGLPS